MRALTSEEMRAADGYTINTPGVTSQTLMQRAGAAIADEVCKVAKPDGKILIVCGVGNNGGDGYVCARELIDRGFNVSVYAFDGKLSPDCEREKAKYNGTYSRDISGDIIVDCIFGTGLTRRVEGEYAVVIERINKSGALIISADIPSGLCGDNGLALGCAVRADITVAIAEYKTGFFLNDGLDLCGKIIKKDIGIVCPNKNYALVNYMPCGAFEKRKRNTHKGSFGTASIVAGSERYVGAAVLAAEAALKSGCGYVKLATCEKLKYAMAVKFPQIIYTEKPDFASQALAVGCGLGVSRELYETISFILKNYCGKLVLDADALNTISKYGADILKDKNCEAILTPHVKEFSRLCGLSVEEVIENPIKCAKDFALEYKVIVVLKSASTVICDGRRTVISARGTSALAKGGSGDMLTGFMCGALARGVDAFDGAVSSVHALGLAAEIASLKKTDFCATATDIIKNLHFSVMRLTEE